MNSYETRIALIDALNARQGKPCRVLFDADFGRSTAATDRDGNPIRDAQGNVDVYEDDFDAKYLMPKHTCYVRHTNAKERVLNPMLWVECGIEEAEAVYCVGFAMGRQNNFKPRQRRENN